MGRTTFAGLGIAAALLAGAPAWASSMVDITGALATDSAASGSAGVGAASALKTVKGSLQKSLPAFTPPKIDMPEQTTAKTPGTSGSSHTSSGGSGASAWRAASGSKGGGPSKSSWATRQQGGPGAKGGASQCWAKASTPAKGATASNAWKSGGTGTRPVAVN